MLILSVFFQLNPFHKQFSCFYFALFKPNMVEYAKRNDSMYNTNNLKNKLDDFYQSIIIKPTTTSTNNDLKELASSLQNGDILIANHQNQGRGRNGKSFYCEEGKGIYLSLFLRPQLPLTSLLQVTGAIAVSLVEAIQSLYHLEASIKWVNDIYIEDKKVAGILCETSLHPSTMQLDYLIIGVGINVHSMNLPDELKNSAGSIEDFTSISHQREELVIEMLNRFLPYYNALPNATFLDAYKQYSNVLQRKITVYEYQQIYDACVLDIDSQGGLVIQTKEGIKTLTSGEISIRKQ